MTVAVAAEARAEMLLEDIRIALTRISPELDSVLFDLSLYTVPERERICDALGRGEVSIRAGDGGQNEITESVFPGVWHCIFRAETGKILSQTIEVGAIVRIVRAINLSAPLTPHQSTQSEGIMNGPAVLDEVLQAAQCWRPGMSNHVVNMTLMPFSAQDRIFLMESLGLAPLEIVARNYGACRVLSMAVRHVWAVQYMNSEGKIVLDTLEVGDVPLAAQAAQQDFDDSAIRLQNLLMTGLT